MESVIETLLLGFFLWLLLWLVARPRRRRIRNHRDEYNRLLNTNTWINFAARLKYGKTCYRCYRQQTPRSPLTVHHVDYLHTRQGKMLVPWDPAYLRRNLLRVVCWRCHKQERPARWLLHP